MYKSLLIPFFLLYCGFKDESSHQSYSPCRPRCDPARNPNRCGYEGTHLEGAKGTEGTEGEGTEGTKSAKGTEGTKSAKGAEADLTK